MCLIQLENGDKFSTISWNSDYRYTVNMQQNGGSKILSDAKLQENNLKNNKIHVKKKKNILCAP